MADAATEAYQSMEDFWGLELSSKKKKVVWDEVDEDLDLTLELRQACLGAQAKDGERNVVQVTAENEEGEEVTHSILSMRVGGVEQTQLFLSLHPPVTFELASGSGPIHVVGSLNQVLMPLPSDDGSEDESEEEESEEESVEESEEVSSEEVEEEEKEELRKGAAKMPSQKMPLAKKRPASALDPPKPAKMAKISRKEKKETMETSSSADLSISSTEATKSPVKGMPAKKRPVLREEESDEDEEDGDFDDESDEEEEEEMEEEIKVRTVKTPQNGSVKGKVPPVGRREAAKTPQLSRPAKSPAKGARSAPATPKGGAADKKTPKKTPKTPPGITEVKEKLLKMTVPKKADKFGNFLSHSFKITDDKVKKQLWEFVLKNKPLKT